MMLCATVNLYLLGKYFSFIQSFIIFTSNSLARSLASKGDSFLNLDNTLIYFLSAAYGRRQIVRRLCARRNSEAGEHANGIAGGVAAR